MVHRAYLSLGSNEGNREKWLLQAIALIGSQAGHVTATSSIYETAAWGLTEQPSFLNMALELHMELTPMALLDAILHIERELGRERLVKWGPRTIDIDILFYDQEVLQLPELTIPHPYLHERRFVLQPLTEIAGTYEHPVLHKAVQQLLEECPDKLEVHVFSKG